MSDPLDLRGQLIRDMRYAATPHAIHEATELIPIDLAVAVVEGHINYLMRELQSSQRARGVGSVE